MKPAITLLLSLLLLKGIFAQTTTSDIYIVKLYSQNKQYYLKSIPYDNEESGIYGRTGVYKTANDSLLYSISRKFIYTYFPNKITLSNNGQVVAFMNDYYENDKIEEQKALLFYKNGDLAKTYTTTYRL